MVEGVTKVAGALNLTDVTERIRGAEVRIGYQ